MAPRRRPNPSRPPHHKWTVQERLVLSLFDLRYRNPPKDLAAIISYISRNVLHSEGLYNGLSRAKIGCQLQEFKHGGTGSRYYNHVAAFTPEERDATFEHVYRQISEAARILRIDLIAKSGLERQENHPLPRLPIPLRRTRFLDPTIVTETTTVSSWDPNSDDTDVDECFVTPISDRIGRRTTFDHESSPQQSSGFLSIRLNDSQLGRSYNQRPRLLFRGFDSTHGLRARGFLHSQQIPPPPAFSSWEFKTQVRPHLCRDETYASPFMSWAQNPAVALNHVFNKVTENNANVNLAIFKYDDVYHDARRKFGNDCGPYLCSMICDHHRPMDLPYGSNGQEYEGYGEFLVWGAVTCNPVAIIDKPEALMLRAIIRNIRELTFETGLRLAKYIPKNMDYEYVELFLCLLVRRYKVHGHEQSRVSEDYANFIRGATSMLEANQSLKVSSDQNEDDYEDDCVVVEPLRGIVRFAEMDWASDTSE